MQTDTISDTQHLPVTAQPIDSAKNPGVLAPGAVATWSTSNPAVAVVAPDPGDPTGLTATVSAIAPGICNITCIDQNPAGTISDAFSLTVTGGNAVGFTFLFGTPS